MDSFGESVRGFIQRLVGDYHVSQDLAQDTFLKAFLSLKNLDTPSAFGPWLFRIAFHVAIDYRRRRDHSVLSLESVGGASVAIDERQSGIEEIHEADESATRHRAVVRAVADLPEPYALIVVLRYLEHHSYFEMAGLLDLSLANVKVRLHRARKMIRDRITAEKEAALLTPRLEERRLT